MRKVLAGIETEYGLLVEGRGAEHQVDDAMALVRAYPGECLPIWDYRYESPRTDLRGFRLDRLAFDPEDAKFDAGKTYVEAHEIRSDRILPNGARFYNDHGHPEYSTPECLSLQELAKHDCAGQKVVLNAAKAFEEQLGRRVQVYKNNTDYHGASYGTHEGYLVPREVGFDRLFPDLMPMLVVRQILCGSGSLGDIGNRSPGFRLSQRSDYMVEPANTETLYRRPIFNTRDEPHADPRDWIRLHVICGDANLIPNATARKVGLIKLALALCEIGEAPKWELADPVKAFQAISLDSTYQFRVDLKGRNWTTAYQIFESYFSAAERLLDLDDDLKWVITTSRQLLSDLQLNFDQFRFSVDWAAKKSMLISFAETENPNWSDPQLRAFDLEYHNVDPEDGLHAALEQMGEVEADPDEADLWACLEGVQEPTRAFARGLAIKKFKPYIIRAAWRSMTFRVGEQEIEVDLPPDGSYPSQLAEANDVETFTNMLRGIR